ncbi:hypothetical protein A4X13_0g1729 [Tilletia indica]|uniref:Uncharacterized protein n=1 Tax=Tilletia indica TaxID=43049 RepID=A0A177TGH4_9BASI|nr:hypothetical protein A4X13_0g1729 [Tilletia indica]
MAGTLNRRRFLLRPYQTSVFRPRRSGTHRLSTYFLTFNLISTQSLSILRAPGVHAQCHAHADHRKLQRDLPAHRMRVELPDPV